MNKIRNGMPIGKLREFFKTNTSIAGYEDYKYRDFFKAILRSNFFNEPLPDDWQDSFANDVENFYPDVRSDDNQRIINIYNQMIQFIFWRKNNKAA